jgi:UDP-glucose 4-epimerase
MGIFMNQVMAGRPLSVFGDGSQERAFNYVGDLVPAITESPWVPAARYQIFNIGCRYRLLAQRAH